jgi:hypothetical protein
MRELLQLLVEETESEERSLWYNHGWEVEQRALQALKLVLDRALYRLDNDGK